MLKKILIATGVILLLLLIAGWLLFGVFVNPGEKPHTGQLALVNGHFLTMAADEPEIIEDKAMIIEDGSISAFVEENKLLDDIDRIDLQNGYAIPGLFDSHIHLGGVPGVEGYSLPGMMLEFLRSFPNTRKKFLQYGVTTVVSLGDGHPQGIEIREDIASGKLAGPRLLVAGPMLTSPGGHPVSTIFEGNEYAIQYATRQLDDPQEARNEVNRLAEDGVDLIKVIYTAGRNNELPRMKYEVLEAIIDQAHRRDLKVVVHTDTRKDINDAIRAGADGLEHIVLDLGDEIDQILGKVEEQNIEVVPTYAVIQKISDQNSKDNIHAEFTKWLQYDIPIVLGTDAGNIPAGESVYTEMQLYVQAGMSPYEALQTATINAARHVGLESVLGSLEPGKHADLVVFEVNPLEHIQNIQSPRMVFKEGNLKFNK